MGDASVVNLPTNQSQSDRARPEGTDSKESAWVCAEGFYENGHIIATVPALQSYDSEQMTYSVDVALNGQQFTGKPVNFRYYDVHIE